jgi:hypothetical protein
MTTTSGDNEMGEEKASEKLSEALADVDRQLGEVLRFKETPYRPVVATVPESEATTAPPEGREIATLPITERLRMIEEQLNLISSYMIDRTDTLESKMDQIMAILK